MKPVVSSIAIAILASSLFSCKDNASQPVEGSPPTKDQFAFIPMYVGNIWAYADSMGTDSVFLNRTLEVHTVTHFSLESGRVWWKDEFLGISTQYAITDDGVYTRQYSNSAQILRFVPPPPVGDTLVYIRQMPDNLPDTVTVYQLSDPFATHCGTFDSVAVYEVRTYLHRLTTYVRPRIGILRTELFSEMLGYITEKQDLIYYRVLQ